MVVFYCTVAMSRTFPGACSDVLESHCKVTDQAPGSLLLPARKNCQVSYHCTLLFLLLALCTDQTKMFNYEGASCFHSLCQDKLIYEFHGALTGETITGDTSGAPRN